MPDEEGKINLQETGRFELIVGLDDDGDLACTYRWQNLDAYSVVGYLETFVTGLKANLASRWAG